MIVSIEGIVFIAADLHDLCKRIVALQGLQTSKSRLQRRKRKKQRPQINACLVLSRVYMILRMQAEEEWESIAANRSAPEWYRRRAISFQKQIQRASDDMDIGERILEHRWRRDAMEMKK